jgi:hypothetical protein
MPRCAVGRGCHGGDEQDRGVVGTNPAAGQQRGSVAGDGGGEVLFQVVDLVDFQLCAATDEQQGAQPGECFAQLRVGRHEHGFELVIVWVRALMADSLASLNIRSIALADGVSGVARKRVVRSRWSVCRATGRSVVRCR